MKKSLFIALMTVAVSNVYAAGKQDASAVVKQYSETVACQLAGISEYQKNQYKAVEIQPGMSHTDSFGAIWVVFWEGDLGCNGGNGTIIPNFTVVEHSGFGSADPVVKTEYKFPKMSMARLTSFSEDNGKIHIKGVTYGPDDRQHSPSKVVSYTLQLDGYNFVKE